jgi:hypothetical protein
VGENYVLAARELTPLAAAAPGQAALVGLRHAACGPFDWGRGGPGGWLIDALARTLEVLKLENGRWTILATHAGDEVVRAEPFDAVELELAAL